MISCDPQGRISVEDLEKALAVIKHKPDEEVGHKVIEKLDVDKDGFVELEHVLGLVREEGLGALSIIIVFVSVVLITCLPIRYPPRRRSPVTYRAGQRAQEEQAPERGYRTGMIRALFLRQCYSLDLMHSHYIRSAMHQRAI